MIQEIIDQAIEYKRGVAGAFYAITPDEIGTRIAGETIYATTKIDGEYNLLYFDGQKSRLINRNGKVKDDLPILTTITKSLGSKGVASLKATVELHVKDAARCRVYDVMSALSEDPGILTVSAFDLLEIDGVPHHESDYKKTLERLSELLDGRVVEMQELTKAELEDYFDKKVTGENQEGLVLRSPEFPFVYKLKPLHTIDLAVIGYTAEAQKLRTFLLALMDEAGRFIQIATAGTGLDDTAREALFTRLSAMHVDSSYIEVDRKRVAFHMVRPEIVVEIAANDLITESKRGIVKSACLQYDDGYELLAMIPSVSLIHPVIRRIREDKQVNAHDVRLAQVLDGVDLDPADVVSPTLPAAEVIFREVYTKASKGMTNVRKFLIVKTNKEKLDSSYPAYVFHSTDFSPTRKDPLKKEIRISNSKAQIEGICAEFIESNIKKGWKRVE